MAKYEPVSRHLIDPVYITYMLQPFLGLENCYKFYGKYKIFLMAVYMIFKYSKRFRFAPSFNYFTLHCRAVASGGGWWG